MNEIYEFGLYCVNSIDSSSSSWSDASAFESKTTECISKLKISNSSNHNIELLVIELEKTLRDKKNAVSKNDKSDWLLIIGIFIVFGLIYLAFNYFSS